MSNMALPPLGSMCVWPFWLHDEIAFFFLFSFLPTLLVEKKKGISKTKLTPEVLLTLRKFYF